MPSLTPLPAHHTTGDWPGHSLLLHNASYMLHNVEKCFVHSHLIASGNCALVTRKVDISLWCSRPTSWLISGYMMGSPTRDRAQCLACMPSAKRSGCTPGTPAEEETSPVCVNYVCVLCVCIVCVCTRALCVCVHVVYACVCVCVWAHACVCTCVCV